MIRSRRLRVIMGPVLIACLCAVASCGVPRNDEARPIAEQEPIEGSAPPTTPGGLTDQSLGLYFVRDQKLVRVERPVEKAPTVTDAIRTLLGGPTPEDQAINLLSSIPPDTRLLEEPVLNKGVLTVDLSAELGGITGDTFKQACAQIVFTATEFDDVSQVGFRIEGKAIAVPTDEGNLDTVGRTDFSQLAPT